MFWTFSVNTDNNSSVVNGCVSWQIGISNFNSLIELLEFKLFNLNLPKAPPKGIFAILFNKILIGSINELLILTIFNSSSIIDETSSWFSISLKFILSSIFYSNQ